MMLVLEVLFKKGFNILWWMESKKVSARDGGYEQKRYSPADYWQVQAHGRFEMHVHLHSL